MNGVTTIQNFQESLSLRVFKFEDSKRSSGWDMMLAFFLINFNFWHVRAQVRAFDDLDHLAVFWDLLFHRFIVYGASQNLSFFNLIIFWVVSEQFRHHTEVIFRINLHFVGILRILWHWERGKLFEMLKIGGSLWHWARKGVLHLLELQIG